MAEQGDHGATEQPVANVFASISWGSAHGTPPSSSITWRSLMAKRRNTFM